jgi:hypothetical protein
MQPVRVYKEILSSTPSRRVGPCGLHVFLEWASSLADSGYAKSKDPKGHSLVNSALDDVAPCPFAKGRTPVYYAIPWISR